MIKKNHIVSLTILCLGFLILKPFSLAAQKSKTNLPKKNLKTYFIQNKGQLVNQFGKANNEVVYLLNTPGLNVHLKRDGFSYDFYTKEIATNKTYSNSSSFHEIDSLLPKSSIYKFHRLDVQFLGANSHLKFKTSEAEGNKFNYYTSESQTIQRVGSFEKVVYKSLYPNIDLEFYVPDDKKKPVEYNFIIHPNGKISDIRMKFSGAEAQYHKKHLTFSLAMGKMKETIPLSWLEKEGKKNNVDISFHQIESDIFGFSLKNQKNHFDGQLTIDPTPVRLWSTYFGGEGDEAQYNGDVDTDSNGNVYISGYTTSFNNIATVGSFQTTYTSISENGYLAKFQPDGTLEWATYYGENRTLFRSITIDGNDNVIGVGETYSAVNIGTPGTHQPQLNNSSNNYFDGFIVKFDTNGIRQWGTYFGGESFDYCTVVSTDNANNIYVGGDTASNTNIATTGAFRNTGVLDVHSNLDTFLLKLNTNGQRVWSTYYGGRYANGLDVDSSGNIFMSGDVQGYSGQDIQNVGTSGSYQENYSDENLSWNDVFLVKFDPTGNRLWGTYYGGDSYDNAYGLVVDNDDNVIICGSTRSNIFPTTDNAHQRIKTAEYYDNNAFLAKFSPNGDIIWNTLYGGEDGTAGLGVDVDASNNVFMTGGTTSFNNIATPDSYQETKSLSAFPGVTSSNAYIVKFDPLGTRIWGTYYGGNHSQQGLSVDVDIVGDLYLMGYVNRSTTLATPGAHQENINGFTDNFLVKFKDCESSVITEVPSGVCEGDDILLTASGGISYEWTGPNGFFSTDANPIVTNASFTNSGVYTVSIIAADGCDDIRTFEIKVSVRPSIGDISNLYGCANEGETSFSSLFDTENIHQQAINGQTGVIVYYFNIAGDPLPSPLPNPMVNSLADHETITVRVVDEINQKCYIETSFDLIVVPNPVAFSLTDIVQCDDDNDGFAVFDFSAVEAVALNNQLEMEVSLFDQSGNQLQSSATSYTNSIPNRETIRARVTNPNTGCFDEVTFDIIVGESPYAFDVNELFGCDENDDGIATNFNTSSVIDAVLGQQTGMEVTFYHENGNLLPSPLPNPYTNSVPDLEKITIRVTNLQTGCYSETEQILYAASKPDIEQPEDRFSCNNGEGFGSFDLKAITEELIGGKSGLTILFRDSSENQINNSLTDYQSTNQLITIRVENKENTTCSIEFNLNLIVNEFSNINLNDNYVLCALVPYLDLHIEDDYEMYEWYDPNGILISTSSTSVVSEIGNYKVNTVKTQNNIVCQYSHTFNLVRSDLPIIDEVKYKELGSNYIEIIASGDGNFEYSIDGEIYQDSNYFSSVDGGYYTVYVRDKNNCGEDFKTITILDYPKFFTPNADGINDFWQIKGIESYPNAKIFIYDRYGKLLKQLNPQEIGWSGEYNGSILPSSDYWFTLNLKGTENYSGHFSLKR